ncbi:MAG: ArnT family glycosyltransferase [Acidobacteriota bacterium]
MTATRSRTWWLVLLLVWGISTLYLVGRLDRGWVPHDEGGLAQSAERVLAGETPHRDFDEIYTGGLSYLNALAFRTFGTRLMSLRLVLLAFFLAWIPALYFIASRFVAPLAAGTVVLLAVAWSVPNYSAAIPSWYNLFFAVFGSAALLRYLESSRGRWLVVAGLSAGLSCLAKIVGLYFVAAVLLFLVLREQTLSQTAERERDAGRAAEGARGTGQAAEGGKGSARGAGQAAEDGRNAGKTAAGQREVTSRLYGWFIGACLLVLLAFLLILALSGTGAAEYVHFLLPGATLAALYLWNERQEAHGSSRTRLSTLARLIGPFALGLVVPIALFLIPYLTSGALPALLNGLFVAPFKRLSFATMSPPDLLPSIFATLPLVLLLGGSSWRQRPRWPEATLIVLALGAGLAAAGEVFIYQLVWYSVRTLVPATTLAGVVLLHHPRSRAHLTPLRRQQLMLLLTVMVMVSLVQFPFSSPIYFCYVAPTVALALVAIVASQQRTSTFVPAALLCFYLAFGVLWVNPGFIYNMGFYYAASDQTEELALDRGGLRVSQADKQQYEQLVAAMRAHAVGRFAYATPDCPEVYFLSGLRNPTRTIFDFFDDPEGRAARILESLERSRVGVVALNREPRFSDAPPPELAEALAERFPQAMEIGTFTVRWRE